MFPGEASTVRSESYLPFVWPDHSTHAIVPCQVMPKFKQIKPTTWLLMEEGWDWGVSFNGTLLTEGRETPIVVNGTYCLFSVTSEEPEATLRER